MKAQSTFSLKDQLFNPEKVDFLAALIAKAHPAFERAKFSEKVLAKFPELELKQRIVHISECLESFLPQSYPQSIKILLKSLPPELDPGKTDDDFGDFIFAPVSHFVVLKGCNRKHLKCSLEALYEITKRFSAEDAIRYFINAFPEETFEFLEGCSRDENYHVRRLASEGTRPKLPWSQKLVTGYELPISILDELHKDPTRYVTRSVANHLNDISKISPETVIGLLKKWKNEKLQKDKELDFVFRHSLRSLVKESHADALQLLGFGNRPDIQINDLKINSSKVKLGDTLEFSLKLTAGQKQKLLIDYLMEFPSGRSKVFKIKQVELEAGESIEICKRHPMRLMTTRAQELGQHRIVLQINGKRFDSCVFSLIQ